MTSSNAKVIAANTPPQSTLAELKRRYGTDGEDELLLRIQVPEADVARMKAAGPVKRDYPLLSSPNLEQVRKLMKLATSPVIEIKSSAMNLSLRRKRG